MLSFRLIAKCWQNASYYKDDDVDFLLEENEWNDYGYQTTYHLHITSKIMKKAKGAVYLGAIQIMKLGQATGEDSLLKKYLGGYKTFGILPSDFFSITFSYDLYKNLSQNLSEEERRGFVDSLHLILKEDDIYYPQVKDDECFQTSLLRGAGMDSYYLISGRKLLFMEGTAYNLRNKKVKVKYKNATSEVELDFSSVKGLESNCLPNGIIVFIGKNGSGKSTALYQLAALLYATPSTRKRYEKLLGTIAPSDLGISQLMIFSYSPFDNFCLPGQLDSGDITLWANQLESRKGRFIYCGLRNVKAEADALLSQMKGESLSEEHIRLQNITLKDQSLLAKEAFEAFCIVKSDIAKNKEWSEFLSSMELCQKELFIKADELMFSELFSDKSWEEIFQNLSTGHKFFFHSMLHIIAYCEENALLLFDEPENHLQAPLLSFMMASIRKVLSKRSSVMLVATHSPVILQETLSDSVRIVRRDKDQVSFSKPLIETFGESYGAISSEVFDMTSDRVQFFTALDYIYEQLKCDYAPCVQDAIDLISYKLGGISSQSIHYIASKYLKKSR